MLDKKKEDKKKPAEQEALERRVDAMMDPRLPDAPADPPEQPALTAVTAAETPVRPVKSVATAPLLPAKLRKQMEPAGPAKPISIKKLDEITKKISGPETSGETEEDEPKVPNAQDTEETPPADISGQSTELDDARTEEAVDDIVSHEGDVMLAVSDAAAAERNRQIENASDKAGGKSVFATILWFLVFAVAIIALVLLGLLITGGNVTGLRNL